MSIRIGIGLDNFASAGIDANATTIYNRIIADGGVSNLTRLNFFVKGLKAIYGDLANVPVCYDAHWIGYKLGSGTGTTAGQAAAKLYSLTVAGDAVQSTAASQPLLLSHNGASSDNYYYAVPTTGNYCLSSLSYNTSDWDVEFKINGKYASVQDRVVSTRVGGNGTTVTVNATSINLEYSIATVFYFATALVTNTNDVDYTIRVTRNSTTGAVTFIRNGVTLTTTGVQLLGTLDGVSNLIEINGSLAGVQAINAKIYYCNLYIAGNIVRNFNPATYNAATSQTQWTSSTGEVWTINTGTATTGYKGVLVDRTIVQGDGVDDNISVAISGNAIRTQYIAHKSLGANTGAVGGLFLTAANSQAFSYNSNKYNFYQQGAFDGPFGAVVVGTTNRALRISGAVGGTGTNWIPFQNGVDVSNGGANIGTVTSYSILTLFSRGNITSFDNAIFNTYIMSANADDLTTRTASQAFAKSLNNNI